MSAVAFLLFCFISACFALVFFQRVTFVAICNFGHNFLTEDFIRVSPYDYHFISVVKVYSVKSNLFRFFLLFLQHFKIDELMKIPFDDDFYKREYFAAISLQRFTIWPSFTLR